MTIKKDFVKIVSRSLGYKPKEASFLVSFIIDLIHAKTLETGYVKIDEHLFVRKIVPEKKFIDNLFHQERVCPARTTVVYHNSRDKNKRIGGKNEIEAVPEFDT